MAISNPFMNHYEHDYERDLIRRKEQEIYRMMQQQQMYNIVPVLPSLIPKELVNKKLLLINK